MARTKYSINIDDGRIVYRTGATDRLVALYRKIDDAVAEAIFKGELAPMDVVNAIMGSETQAGKFDWKQFKKDKQMLNMRQNQIELEEQREEAEALPDDKPGEVQGLGAIKLAIGRGKKAIANSVKKEAALAQAKSIPSTPPPHEPLDVEVVI